jgi:putative cell wall-binding protein
VPSGSYPVYTNPDGSWSLSGPRRWVAGFFPGSLWYEYERSASASWRTAAIERQAAVRPYATDTGTHDIGFMMMPGFGHGYRLTGDPAFRQTLLTAADSLSQRYDPAIGMVRTLNTAEDFWVYNDTMINIGLLYWGARNGGDRAWRDMGTNHALRTVRDFLRPDGGSYHYVAYDESTGRILDRGQGQGYADESTWSRGQAWIIYGLTTAYAETGDPRLLQGIHRATDYWEARCPDDLVPYWDFDAPRIPDEPRDDSAAAIAASAFVELSRLEPDAARRARYGRLAEDTLATLCSPAYLSNDPEWPALLMHGTYAAMIGAADHGTSWGDYYFREALMRQTARVRRSAGPDRYLTAVRASRLAFDSADIAVVASGADYPDALAASALAGAYDTPLLLTEPHRPPSSVRTEIARLGVREVVIIGGSDAVDTQVERAFDAMPGVDTRRIAGANRYETATAVATAVLRADPSGGRVFIVRGDAFADALAVSPLAYSASAPVLLVEPDAVPRSVRALLADPRITDAVIVGGSAAVSPATFAQLDSALGVNATRVGGADRYATAALVAEWGITNSLADPAFVGLATGSDYPDGLTGGAVCGAHGGVLLLSMPAELGSPAEEFLRTHATLSTGVEIFGGETAVPGVAAFDASRALMR